MKIWYVQENSAYGIEGQPEYFTDVENAQLELALKIFNGSKVGDSVGANSFKEVLDFLEWRGSTLMSDGEDWRVSVAEHEIAVWRDFMTGCPDGTVEDFEDWIRVENNIGNVIFEAGLISIDNPDTIAVNKALQKTLEGES